MKTTIFAKAFTFVMMAGILASHSLLYAQSGYMAFLTDPSRTTVTTGDASSYMRAGTDWDGATISGGVAIPTLLQKSVITSWRDTSALHFIFVVPDRTTTQGGATLACGDQIVVQVGQANSPDNQLQPGKEFRFEVVIQNNQITPQPIGSTTTGPVGKRLPLPIGTWNAIAEPSTTANATLTLGGNQYQIALDIPLSEINNPTGDIGLSLAILNDLGHSHTSGTQTINEASGTGFPLGMGLTPESDPGLSCGTQPGGVTASGNWITPSTWGTGYFNNATVAGNVTLSQSPQFSLSDAIRIGKCDVTNFNSIPAVSAANWITVQQTSGTWYLYNPAGPCRMGVWINPNVTGTGVVKRRFLVVWGRPGISPQDWYFAGLTDPVALAPPNTPISFIWNNVNAVPFSDHPCMRVYVLPEVLSAADQTFLTPLQTTTGTTQAALDAMEAHFGVAQGSTLSAQMNFSNIGTGVCTAQQCTPLIGFRQDPGTWNGPQYALAAPPLALSIPMSSFQGATTGQASQPGSTRRGGGGAGENNANLVRIFAHGFAVPEPKGNRRYVYVDPIGSLGWAFPANLFGKGSMSLNMDVTLPKVEAKMIIGGKTVAIPSSPSRVYVALVTDAVPGTPIPKIDAGALNQIGNTLMTPGETVPAKIGLSTSSSSSTARFAVFFDIGVAIPHGTFSNAFNAGFSFNGGLEYIITPHISAEGILGVHHFPGKIAGDTTAIQFGGGGKVFLNPGHPNLVFVRAGIAGYHFTSATTNVGGYFGAGLLHQFNVHLGLEGVYTFHAVNTPGAATQFSTLQGGFRYAF
jgi:hypothetical protein